MRKRSISIILMLLLILSNSFYVNAFSDNIAPTINDVIFKNYDSSIVYSYEDIIEIEVQASDNIELSWIELEIWDAKNEQSYYFGAYHQDLGNSGISEPLTATGGIVKIPVSILPTGNYSVQSVSVYDTNNNNSYKHLGNEGIIFNITVNNPTYGQDLGKNKRPQIEGINVTPKEGNSKTTEFIYTINVNPGETNIESVSLMLSPTYSGGFSFRCQPTANENEYLCKIKCDEDFPGVIYNNEIKFSYLEINASGEHYQYYPEDCGVSGEGIYLIDGVKRGDLDFNLTDIVKDTDLPVLDSIKYESAKIFTPDEMHINIAVFDKTTEVNSIDIVVNDFETKEISLYGECAVNSETEGKSTGIFTIDFSRYHNGGKYYVSELKLTDSAGNSSTYVAGEDFDIETFEVVNNNKVDYFTSTTDPDLLGVIKNAVNQEDKVVVVNVNSANSTVPKELFEEISGKDITVIFEKVIDYSAGSGTSDEGLQWIFNGKYVNKNKAKDIDVYFYIEEAVDNSWVKKQEKHYETPFPYGASDGGGPNFDQDQSTKDNLNAAGWGKVIKDIEKEQLPGEGFADAFNRLVYTRYVKFVFADNGELPGKSTIRFKPEYSMRYWLTDYDLELYYINATTNKFEKVEENIDKCQEGYYQFDIVHNSEYALFSEYYGDSADLTNSDNSDNSSNDDLKDTSNNGATMDTGNASNNSAPTDTGDTSNNSATVNTGDTSNVIFWTTLMVVGVICIIVLKKRAHYTSENRE